MTDDATRIVAGFDGSAACRRATRWAAVNAAAEHCPLHLLAAFDWVAVAATVYEPSVARTYRDRALEHLADLLAKEAGLVRHAHPGLHVTTSVHTGSPETLLIEKSRHAGLVVVGARAGRRRSGRIGGVPVRVGLRARIRPSAQAPAERRPSLAVRLDDAGGGRRRHRRDVEPGRARRGRAPAPGRTKRHQHQGRRCGRRRRAGDLWTPHQCTVDRCAARVPHRRRNTRSRAAPVPSAGIGESVDSPCERRAGCRSGGRRGRARRGCGQRRSRWRSVVTDVTGSGGRGRCVHRRRIALGERNRPPQRSAATGSRQHVE